MPEHVHRCLACTPGMVPDFDRADLRYHVGGKCVHRIKQVLIDGIDIGYTAGAFEGPEGWALFAGTREQMGLIHQCTCGAGVCVEPRFGVVTVEHMPPVMIDAAEVLHRLPKGWPGPEATPEIRATFADGWEPFFHWLHQKARG